MASLLYDTLVSEHVDGAVDGAEDEVVALGVEVEVEDDVRNVVVGWLDEDFFLHCVYALGRAF